MTGTVQESELELPKQPGEVSQGPANLLTFLSTSDLLVEICKLLMCHCDSSHSRLLWQTFQGIL